MAPWQQGQMSNLSDSAAIAFASLGDRRYFWLSSEIRDPERWMSTSAYKYELQKVHRLIMELKRKQEVGER
jgi:hypothetical protein